MIKVYNMHITQSQMFLYKNFFLNICLYEFRYFCLMVHYASLDYIHLNIFICIHILNSAF